MPPAKPAPPAAVPPHKVPVISLLLPLGLDHIGPGLSYTPMSLKIARVAADYYCGFKLALDSLTYYGYNYKLQVFDSRAEPEQARFLAYNQHVKASDLVVGPVFPEDIKAFAAAFTTGKPIVSPLSPQSPAMFKNQHLVTVNPPLEYHAWRVAQYINDELKPQKIFILRSGYTRDNDYIVPFKKAADSLSGGLTQVIVLTIAHGRLSALPPQLSKTRQNVFIIPSTDEAFLTVTLRSLDTLAKKYPVTLFGHPGWEHLAFLNTQVLQRLKTHITSADHVNYRSARTINFIRAYRNAWHTQPTAYAVKGFDEGLYFGRLIAEDKWNKLTGTDFTGLYNNFHFIRKSGLGWINTHVNLLLYANFELKQVE